MKLRGRCTATQLIWFSLVIATAATVFGGASRRPRSAPAAQCLLDPSGYFFIKGAAPKGFQDFHYLRVVVKYTEENKQYFRAELTAFDIIVLDVMLPFLDGLEVAKRLRFQNIRTPIQLLTARDAPEERRQDVIVATLSRSTEAQGYTN